MDTDTKKKGLKQLLESYLVGMKPDFEAIAHSYESPEVQQDHEETLKKLRIYFPTTKFNHHE